MFEKIYNSAWHAPLFFWLVGLAFLVLLARRQKWLTGFFILFAFEIIADAWAAGAWSPTPGTALATPLAIAFVILGDFRYFLLVERYVPAPSGGPRGFVWVFGAAVVWAFVVPLLQTAAQLLFPGPMQDTRVTFLTYEVLFLVLAIAFRLVWLPKRLAGASPTVRRWILGLTVFEAVQYALWASSDVLILSGLDIGFLLRLVPNAMYYAFFLPFAFLTAPRDAFDWGNREPRDPAPA